MSRRFLLTFWGLLDTGFLAKRRRRNRSPVSAGILKQGKPKPSICETSSHWLIAFTHTTRLQIERVAGTRNKITSSLISTLISTDVDGSRAENDRRKGKIPANLCKCCLSLTLSPLFLSDPHFLFSNVRAASLQLHPSAFVRSLGECRCWAQQPRRGIPKLIKQLPCHVRN